MISLDDLSQIILIGSQSSRELNYVLYDSSVNQYYWVEGASVYFAGVPCYNLDYALISNMRRKNFKEVKLSLRQTSGEQLTREVDCSELLKEGSTITVYSRDKANWCGGLDD